MKCMVLAGNDKLGRKLISLIPDEDVIKAYDNSISIKRIIRLIFKGRISPTLLIKIFYAEMRRPDTKIRQSNFIRSNQQLIKFIEENYIDILLLFRAGLIINKSVIDSRATVINTHCARIPEFAGLGAIDRAIRLKAFKQVATMHYVVSKIDGGEIIATKPYDLVESDSYQNNENIAYNAGISLLLEQLQIIKSR